MGNVSGNGCFSGNVRFLAGDDPGNSTEQIGSGGGNLGFGQHAVLNPQIAGTTPEGSFDCLAGIAEFDFGRTFRAWRSTVC